MNGRYVVLSSLLVVAAAGLGSLCGYHYGKNKYLTMADREIESVKKAYEKHFKNPQNKSVEKDAPVDLLPNTNNDNLADPYVNKEKNSEAMVKYKNYAGLYGNNGEVVTPNRSIDEPVKHKKPIIKKNNIHVISPEEYRDFEGEIITLIYYSDKVLSDGDGNVIHNINEVIGPEALSTFGRYEDDCVYVKDDEKNIVYEIIWDNKSYVAAHAND